MQNTDSITAFNQLMQQAFAASQKNDSDTALRLFTEASKQLPQAGTPHFLMGAEYAQLGRMAEAEAAYANAVLLEPKLNMARYQLGLVQFTSGRAAMALLTWQPLLELPNDEPLKLFVQGFIELAQDHFENALLLFTKGVSANTTNAPLNADITLLIEKIRQVVVNNQGTQTEQTKVADTNEEASHFLLGSYKQQNPSK